MGDASAGNCRNRLSVRAAIGLVAGVALLLPALAWPTVAAARDLVVYAEPTLRPAIRTLGQIWQAKSGVRVNVFVARSELSFAQIERGARCDVIFALAGNSMDDAENDKLVKAGTTEPIFRNTLMLVGRNAVLPTVPDDLPSIVAGRKLALADPERDLAGSYGVVALAAAGVKVDPESDTVAVAESTAGVLRILADNKAQLGIVFASDAVRRPELKAVPLAPASHPPIEYAVAAAANAQSDPLPFLEFLKSDEAKAAVKAVGLVPIGN